jgi:hypothetical protein
VLLRLEILIAKVPQRHNKQLEIAMYSSNSFGIFLFFSELLQPFNRRHGKKKGPTNKKINFFVRRPLD